MGQDPDRRAFEEAVRALRADLTSAAAMVTWDGAVRDQYQRAIGNVVAELEGEVRAGHLTWRGAAEKAVQLRNDTMEVMRLRSTPPGRAIAEAMKAQGRTLNEMIGKKAVELFPGKAFQALSQAEKDEVCAAVVASAARARPRVNMLMLRASRASRALLVLSLAISVYNIATAEDHWAAAGQEAAVTGAGIAGGIAGGALAGLACGPGAPVCVTIGAFVGGAAAAFGVDFAFFRHKH
jgi:hypothetical protein